jgi:hypothetical protein
MYFATLVPETRCTDGADVTVEKPHFMNIQYSEAD